MIIYCSQTCYIFLLFFWGLFYACHNSCRLNLIHSDMITYVCLTNIFYVAGEWLAQPPIVPPREINSCITLSREDLIAALIGSVPREKIKYGHEFKEYR